MEVFELVVEIILGVGVWCSVFLLGFYFIYWPDSKNGKVQAENEKLRKQVARSQLDNHLLQRQVDELVDMVYGNTKKTTENDRQF